MLGARLFLPKNGLPICAAAVVLLAYGAWVLFGPIERGHDTYLTFFRVGTWVNALAAGDPFSTWTPMDAHGFGSPMPFFYHKLFNLVAASIALVTGDVVMGVRLGLLFFSAVMFFGMCACAARVGADRRAQFVVATACLLSPYAIVSMVQRGAAAEYAAMALVPFIIAFVIDMSRGAARAAQALALLAVLALVALAHVIIFVAVVGLLMLYGFGLYMCEPRMGAPLLAVTGVALVAFFALVYVPFDFWAGYFSPTQARLNGLPANNTVPLLSVFSIWPRSWFAWPVPVLLIGLAVQLRHRRDPRALLVLLAGAMAFALLLLMTRPAAPLWRLSGQLDFVQFPWRLLSIATPLMFVAFAGMLEQLSPLPKARLQIAMLAIATLHVSLMLFSLNWHIGPVSIDALRDSAAAVGPGPDAGGEYFPARYRQRLADTPDILRVRAGSILPEQRPLLESAGGCEAVAAPGRQPFRELRVAVVCGSAGWVRINQFLTPFLDVSAVEASGLTSAPVPGNPFMKFSLPAGHWTLDVRERSYLELVALAWRARLSHLRTAAPSPVETS